MAERLVTEDDYDPRAERLGRIAKQLDQQSQARPDWDTSTPVRRVSILLDDAWWMFTEANELSRLLNQILGERDQAYAELDEAQAEIERLRDQGC